MNDSLKPVRCEVAVPADADRAFTVFTDRFSTWWPPEFTFSEESFDTAIIESRDGGRWFERAADGEETDWGQVVVCDPPHHLVLTWRVSPERTQEPPDKASEIEIRFLEEESSRTRVELEHRHFARHGEGGAMMRAGMDSEEGWPKILGRYAEALAA